MDKQGPFRFAVHLPTSYPSDGSSLQTLIFGCRNGDRAAWEELLSRYTRQIVGTIIATLKRANRRDLAQKQDIRYEVYVQIVCQILEKGLPSTLVPRGLSSWLETVSHNETITWLRKHSTKKNVIKEMEEGQTTHLETLAGPETDQTLGDMLKGDDPAEQEETSRTHAEVARLLAAIAGMDPQSRLVFKVCLMFYDSLSNQDIREIAEQRGEPVKKVRSEVAAVREALLEREAQRVRYQDLAGITWYLVQKLERRLMDHNQNPNTAKTAVAELQEELDRQRKRHETFVKKAGAIVRPTNEEICRLLGLDASDRKIVRGISLKVFRMRKELRGEGDGG